MRVGKKGALRLFGDTRPGGSTERVPGGQHHSICVGPEAIANPNAGRMDQARVANSGVLVSEWVGGNLPELTLRLTDSILITMID